MYNYEQGLFNDFNNWEITEDNRYFSVVFYVQGKEFKGYIRCSLNKKNWLCIYKNTNNDTDYFIRSETISTNLWKHRITSTKEEFDTNLSLILSLINIY